jgi:SAM-dependent methyltransferase
MDKKPFTKKPVFKKSTKLSKKPFETKSLNERSHKEKVVTKKQQIPGDTSWGDVASWYNTHLEKSGDTYHEKIVYPNLFRILGDVKGIKVLDLACGQGQFSRLLRDNGAYVTGVDLGKELIAIAESHNPSIKETGTHKVNYFHGSADDLYMLKSSSAQIVVCVLALQNIEKLQKTIEEVNRVLADGGRFIFVLNHPSFRNPRQSRWGYDEQEAVQYRRIDEYMSESHVKIDMTPGSKTNKKFTVSFHRPLQVYMKALFKSGFVVSHFEEWVSHRVSEQGPKKKAEDTSRKEIPLFLCIEAKKV